MKKIKILALITFLFISTDSFTQETTQAHLPTPSEDIAQELLFTATQKGSLNEVKKALTAGADPHIEGPKGTAVYLAAKGGHLDIIKYLIKEKKVDIKKPLTIDPLRGFTCLYIAAIKNHIPVVKYLIEKKGISPHKPYKTEGLDSGFNLLYTVSHLGYLELARYLIERHRANPNSALKSGYQKGTTALYVATLYGHLELLKYYIEKRMCSPKATIRSGHAKGHNLLSAAVMRKQKKIILYLVNEKKVNPGNTLRQRQTYKIDNLALASKYYGQHHSMTKFLRKIAIRR